MSRNLPVIIVNGDDVDPISFEPINELTALWYCQIGVHKWMAYDAWAWLQLICLDAKAKHPITRKELNVGQRWKIYEACLADPSLPPEAVNPYSPLGESANEPLFTDDTDLSAMKTKDREGTWKERQKWLDQCSSLSIRHQADRGAGGELLGIQFLIESPVLTHKIEATDWSMQTFKPHELQVTLHNHVGMTLRKTRYRIAEDGSEVTLIGGRTTSPRPAIL